eukprot:jgi/Chlat1/1769/Chrsp134S02092
MGCAVSRPEVAEAGGDGAFSGNDRLGGGVCRPPAGPGGSAGAGGGGGGKAELNGRLLTLRTQTVAVPGAGYTLRYAYASQRGFYPETPDKLNQDALCAHPRFGDDPDTHFFGVFDGHGEHGTPCAIFSKDRMPVHLLNAKTYPEHMERAYLDAFVQTNRELHDSSVDDSMSGTTGITVTVRGRNLFTGNVGDSRAVLAERRANGRLAAVDLSLDQTPFRADECQRVRECGARVLTLDQLEGLKDPNVQCWGAEDEDDGDPPRLWSPYGTFPGTAFTRSIGDQCAERIGVHAEPEVTVVELTKDHPFFVIASDGVFEFLPSQSVIDMVAKYDDPHKAVTAIVAESYRLWLQYETRTDDITMICVFIDGLKDAPVKQDLVPQQVLDRKESMGPRLSQAGSLPMTNRPPRRGLAKTRRKAINPAVSDAPEVPFEPKLNPSPKTQAERDFVTNAVKGNFLFSYLSDDSMSMVIDAMTRVNVKAKDVIIKQASTPGLGTNRCTCCVHTRAQHQHGLTLRVVPQHDEGNHFYIVQQGVFDVYIAKDGEGGYGQLVHTYDTEDGANHSFGDLALMYGKPREATVVARSDGVLWALDRVAFRGIMRRYSPQLVLKVLRSVHILESLTQQQLRRLADILTEAKYNDKEYIVRQGDVGDTFYIIVEGEAICTVRTNPEDPNDEPMMLQTLQAHDYFGERALLHNAKRSANVIAAGRVVCLLIGRRAFEELLGPLQAIIDIDRRFREQEARYLRLRTSSFERATRHKGLDNAVEEDFDWLFTCYTTDCYTVGVVQHKHTSERYSLKCISKALAANRKRIPQVLRERDIHRQLPVTPFAPKPLLTIKDERQLSILMNATLLGTLDLVLTEPDLKEEAVRFYAASVVLALEALHRESILFRGINVDMCMMDEHGYLQLVDLRFAKVLKDGPTFTLCGNPEYVAPEMVSGQGHDFAVDWWALGVFIYTLLAQDTPFQADDELQVFKRITAGAVQYSTNWSRNVCDLLSRLLCTDVTSRLGCNELGVEGVKRHSWFIGFDWDSLSQGTLPAPADVMTRMRGAIDFTRTARLPAEPYEGTDFDDF